MVDDLNWVGMVHPGLFIVGRSVLTTPPEKVHTFFRGETLCPTYAVFFFVEHYVSWQGKLNPFCFCDGNILNILISVFCLQSISSFTGSWNISLSCSTGTVTLFLTWSLAVINHYWLILKSICDFLKLGLRFKMIQGYTGHWQNLTVVFPSCITFLRFQTTFFLQICNLFNLIWIPIWNVLWTLAVKWGGGVNPIVGYYKMSSGYQTRCI